jgi:hypothetical protein
MNNVKDPGARCEIYMLICVNLCYAASSNALSAYAAINPMAGTSFDIAPRADVLGAFCASQAKESYIARIAFFALQCLAMPCIT